MVERKRNMADIGDIENVAIIGRCKPAPVNLRSEPLLCLYLPINIFRAVSYLSLQLGCFDMGRERNVVQGFVAKDNAGVKGFPFLSRKIHGADIPFLI